MRRAIATVLLVLSTSVAHAQDSTWFTNVSTSVGLDSIINYFIYVADVNNDDYPDLVLQAGVQTANQIRVFTNTARKGGSGFKDRAFVETTVESGINEQVPFADLAVLGDVNNDGNIDIITATYHYDHFVRNDSCLPNPDNGGRCEVLLGDGAGHFTLKANNGLHELGAIPGSSLSLLDYDRDGNIDLFVGTHYTSWCGVGAQKYLMRGKGDGTFTDVTDASGIAYYSEALFGSNVADWNNDCNQDILTAAYSTTDPGNVWKNLGNGTFEDFASTIGYDPHWIGGDNKQPMVPWAAEPYDFDNDGDMDIFFPLVHGGTGTEGRSSFFINQGAAKDYSLVPDLNLVTRSNPQSSHHGDNQARFLDFDNDKLADFVLTECVYKPASDRVFFFKQDDAHKFTDVTKALGFITGTTAASIKQDIRNPHAAEPLDFDLDGDDDLIVGKYPEDKHFLFLRNDIGNKKNWVGVKLKAPAGVNRSAIGARVRVVSGGVTQMRDVYAGQGNFSAQQPFILNFGLGSDTKIDTIDVRWPDANCSHTVIINLQPNQIVTISKDGSTNKVDRVGKAGKSLTLGKSYPNPVKGIVRIPFELPEETMLDVDLFDSTGRLVLSAYRGRKASGKYEIATDLSSLAKGGYSYQLRAGGKTLNGQLIIAR